MRYLKLLDKERIDEEVIRETCDETNATITEDTEGDIIKIQHSDAIDELDVKETLRAIQIGFEYHTAIQLYRRPNYDMKLINIKDHTRNHNEFKRQKGRIIGQNGKSVRVISELTDTDIQVNEDIVAVVGSTSDVMRVRRAVLNLISGTPHSYIYNSLETYKRNKRPQL